MRELAEDWKYEIQEKLENRIWTTYDGDNIYISNMTDTHIENTINYLV